MKKTSRNGKWNSSLYHTQQLKALFTTSPVLGSLEGQDQKGGKNHLRSCKRSNELFLRTANRRSVLKTGARNICAVSWIQKKLPATVKSYLNRLKHFFYKTWREWTVTWINSWRQNICVSSKQHSWQDLKHANSILHSFEYFCQISSKSIHSIWFWNIPFQNWAVFETQCSLLYIIASMAAPDDHPFSSVPAAKIKRLTLDLHRLTPARAGSNNICHSAYPPVIRLITK